MRTTAYTLVTLNRHDNSNTVANKLFTLGATRNDLQNVPRIETTLPGKKVIAEK